jgi:hypothetical protein
MKLEFIGKTKGKIAMVRGHSIKLGQKETLPAAQLRIMAEVSNAILDKFSPGMREFLFEKAKGSEKTQKQLEGIEVVSDLPNLREPGVKLGALHWDDEQTGCTFIIDRAIDPIRIPGCKIDRFTIASRDGGSVQVFFTLTTGELDKDTSGDLLLLNQQNIIFELTLPALLSQQQPLEEQPQDDPQKALERAHKGGASKAAAKPITKKPDATKEAANGPKKRRA